MLFLTLLYVLSPSVEPGPQVDLLFADYNKTDVPGAVLGVYRDGQMVFAKGYGQANLEHPVPIGQDTVFYIGSVSKQFVAAAIALLAEAEKLDLDEDIRRWLPEMPDYGEPITIRHLIHHTSGLRDNLMLMGLAGLDTMNDVKPQRVYQLIAAQEKLNHPPGARYSYSNSCYFLLGMIVEKASGQSLRDFAAQHIFEPLGMKQTQFQDDHRTLIPKRAAGYAPGPSGFENRIMRYDLVGSGGLYTTVGDLLKWDNNFYNNRLGKADGKLIAQLLERGRTRSGIQLRYAFGLNHGSYRGLSTVGHNGAMGGFRSEMLRFPDRRFTIVLLSNRADIPHGSLVRQVADIYLADQFTSPKKPEASKAKPDLSARKTLPLDPAQLDAVVGVYASPRGSLIEIKRVGDQLVRRRPRVPDMPMLYLGDRQYAYLSRDDRLHFDTPVDGKSPGLKFTSKAQNIIDAAFTRRPNPFDAADQKAWTGRFHSVELDVTWELTYRDGYVMMQDALGDTYELTAFRKDALLVHPFFGINAVRNQDGVLTGFTINMGRVRDLLFVKQ